MPSLLSDLVRSEFGGVLTQDEAGQLIFLIICTVDWLPERIKTEHWSRSKLSSEFVALTKEGLIRDASPKQKEAEYWNATIDQFMSKQIDIDRTLWTRLCSR
jgi:hypothetical protein